MTIETQADVVGPKRIGRFGSKVLDALEPGMTTRELDAIGARLLEAQDARSGDTRVLKEGMVITIEPFLSTRSRFVEETGDGWTLLGAPGNLSARYEHTMIITRAVPIAVTALH